MNDERQTYLFTVVATLFIKNKMCVTGNNHKTDNNLTTLYRDSGFDLNDINDYFWCSIGVIVPQLSTNTHGPKSFFFTKRFLFNDMNYDMQ